MGRYTYQWSEETLDTFKGEVTLVSLSRVITDTVIGFIQDTIDRRIMMIQDVPKRGGSEYPMVLHKEDDRYEVIAGHNTVVWHILNGSDGLACHVFTEDSLLQLPHLKLKDWQCITGT